MTKNDIPAIREATGAFCRSILDSVLPAIRVAARHKGYAIAVHGSLKRDIDLIAVPWTDQAHPVDELVRAIVGAVTGVLGNCLTPGKPGQKPHGRIAYTLIHPGFAGEIDLSVVAPHADQAGAELRTAIRHLEHMAAWITQQNAGYSFESLGEDMPGMKLAARADGQASPEKGE